MPLQYLFLLLHKLLVILPQLQLLRRLRLRLLQLLVRLLSGGALQAEGKALRLLRWVLPSPIGCSLTEKRRPLRGCEAAAATAGGRHLNARSAQAGKSL